jgi:diguanylate cyclase (GGDEF)-like protein/PAS domain S-box-containing protein
LILWNAALLHQAEARRTRAEQALRKSAEEIEDLYNRAPIGYHSLDSDGKFVRINDTELAWLGYTRDEVVGRMSIADLLTPAGLQTFAENYPLFKARGWVRDLEFDLVRKDGTMLPILLSSTAIKDAQGNFVMSRSSVYDATERKQATDALRESEERFHAIFDWVNDAIFIHDKATGGILDVNRRVCEMYGYSREEALKLDVEALSAGVPPYTQQDALQWLEKAAHGEPQTFEWQAKDKAGRRFWVEVAIRHAALAGQDRLLVSVRDIGERKRAEEVLRESERYTRHLLSELPTAVVVHGPDTTIRYGNATALRLLGLTEDQLLGKTAYDPHWRFLRGDGSTMPPEEYPVNRVIAERRLLRGYLVGVVHGIGAEPVWVYVSAFPTMDSQGELREVVVAFVDITERKRAEEELRALQAQLREQAIRDSLTGLYNRRYLEETLQRELARAKREVHPLSVIMVDIDYFKRLNDTYGHAAGDEVLRTLGRLLQHHARSSDVPCRYGGEEFIVVLPDMPPEAARERAEEIRRDFLDLRIAFAGAELVASLSIGVSGYPAGGKTGDELIRAADQALYEAKQGGRNRVCCARASNG